MLIEVRPIKGEPFTADAHASKYSVSTNDDRGTMRESVRFRFHLSCGTAKLGYSVKYEESEWIVKSAQIYSSANRVVVDAEKESLDYSRCQLADIFQWESEYDCNSRISPKKIYEDVTISVVEGKRESIVLHDSRRTVQHYNIYMEPQHARQLTGTSIIRGKQDFKVVGVFGLEIPGGLAEIEAVVQQSKINRAGA